MNKLFSRTFAVLMSAMILAVPAFATQLRPCLDPVVPVEAETNEIQPRGPRCPECLGEMSRMPTVYGEWKIVGYDDCRCDDPVPGEKDKLMERTKIITYTCGRCGISDETVSTEPKREHNF